MRNIRKNLFLLIIYAFLIFNLHRINFSDVPNVNLSWHLGIWIALLFSLDIALSFFHRISIYTAITLWGSTYVAFGLLLQGLGLQQVNAQIMILEVFLLAVAVILSREISSNLAEIESTLDKLFLSAFSGRTATLEEISEDVKLELTRSRRYHHPLTLLMLEPDSSSLREELKPTMSEISNNLARRYTMGSIAQIINQEARRTDMIIRESSPDRFIVICPETPSVNSQILVNRIISAAQEKLGVSLAWSIAAFPEEGITFEGLLHKAEEKLSDPKVFTLKATSEDSTDTAK
jgi:GGDEF domain-containing protein